MSCPDVFIVGLSLGSLSTLLILAGILFGSIFIEKRAVQRSQDWASRVDTPERWSDLI